jgi:hypothetical protein
MSQQSAKITFMQQCTLNTGEQQAAASTMVLCQLLKHGATLAVLLAVLQGSCFFVAAAATMCLQQLRNKSLEQTCNNELAAKP